ncbi:MAG: PD-(D/E)XK nuclease family transposase [Butyrivibrio sp.]|nr:PD-(D/E)XK nuclease family transposase [Butyrivibrio sp.]
MKKGNYNDQTFEQKVTENLRLTKEVKDELLAIHNGIRIAPLTSAAMSERLFSPDLNPDRFDYIMQSVLQDNELISIGSATNTPALEFNDAKRAIYDLPAWIKDGRYANIEIQAIAQEYFFNRIDIYSSRMLLFQYSTSKGHPKSEIDYRNVNGVAIVALMKESPKLFKDFESPRYIHRFKNAVSDSGMKIPTLRNIAFVQLDKALEMFLSGTYNEDEDYELLTLLALLADPNNEKVKESVTNNNFFEKIYVDANNFSQDKEVQNMLFEEELAIMDYNTSIHLAREEGEEKTNILYAWLFENGRAEDVQKATLDPQYRKALFEEYDKAHKMSNQS